MKNKTWIAALGLVLTLALASPALAKTTAVFVDGKTYTFWGTEPSYEADGKTFVIMEDTVRVLEAGKPDRVLPKETQEALSVVEEITTASTEDIAEASAEDIALATTIAESAVEDEDSDIADDYGQYAQFGLSFDAANSILYYQGQRVRVFQDEYPLSENTAASIAHFDPNGTVDVEAQRELAAAQAAGDPAQLAGRLIGLLPLSQEAFDARNLSTFTEPSQTAVASSGDPLSPQEKAAFYAPYAEVGVHYDMGRDALTYQGMLVRRFLDVRQTNGESFQGGKFKGVMTHFTQDHGEIDISILRDYTQPDADGDGKLIGVQIDAEQ